ncbi:MAG: hypothetical protein AMJ43_04210 [Coxiella sp. DG_40]|nr:MAG: hypothetical protein AMJ43_04210 [Coxiella sp. DG_40]
MSRALFKVVLLLSGLYPIISCATDVSNAFWDSQTSGLLPSVPRVYLKGAVGKELLWQGDILVPLDLGNDKALFLYGQGRVSTLEDYDAFEPFDHAPWSGSLGIGSRRIYGDRLLGAYVLGDYSEFSEGFNYFDISPGIEVLGKAWDFRANGYFPVGKKSWTKEGWADEFGDYDFVRFKGHKEYDRWVRYDHYREVAPGGDAEVGRKLFKGKNTLVKAYLGSYYFDMKDNRDILGVSARITIQPLQYVTFSVNDTYDRQYHNTFMLGVRVRLNDIFSKYPEGKITEDKDLSVRLLDPVERNLGSLSDAASIPASKGKMKPEYYGLEHDNIWFFKRGTAPKGHFQNIGTGTYEDPYVGFDPAKVGEVKDHEHDGVVDLFPLLYFDEGTYDLGVFENNHRFELPGGWGMYGRMNNYLEPAEGDHRALFIGGLDLKKGNNVLDSIRLENNTEGNSSQEGQQDIGINIKGSDVYMNNISVGALNSNEGYTRGIWIEDANGVTLNRSQVYGYGSESEQDEPIGIVVKNGELTLGDSNSIKTHAAGGHTAGIFLIGVSTLKISGSNNMINANTTGTDKDAYSIDADESTESTIDISGSGNNIEANASNGDAAGIFAKNLTLNISGSSNSISANEGSEYAYGIYAENSTVNISGSENSINANINNGEAYGIFAKNSTVYISGNKNNIDATSTSGDAFGIKAEENSIVRFTSTEKTIITAKGTNRWGIYADSSSHLRTTDSEHDIGNLSDLLPYITFNDGGGTGGNRIEWEGKDPLPWE